MSTTKKPFLNLNLFTDDDSDNSYYLIGEEEYRKQNIQPKDTKHNKIPLFGKNSIISEICQITNHTKIIFASKIKPYRKQGRINWFFLYANFFRYVFAHENIKSKTNIVSLEELKLRIKLSENTNKTKHITGFNSQAIFKQFAISLHKEYVQPDNNDIICKPKYHYRGKQQRCKQDPGKVQRHGRSNSDLQRQGRKCGAVPAV
jgi:hypothetical protein